MMRSMSFGSTPDRSIACLLAAVARVVPVSPSETQCRCSIPVRSTIHSCEVSICAARSWLVTMRCGTDIPTPRMRLRWLIEVGYHDGSRESERAAAIVVTRRVTGRDAFRVEFAHEHPARPPRRDHLESRGALPGTYGY